MSIPARRGKAWSEEECLKLLEAVRRKETHEQIAKKHERTTGGIRSRLREIAADYHYYENRPLEDIVKITGLPIESIKDAIEKRKWREMNTKKGIEKIKSHNPTQAQEKNNDDVISLLMEIRDLMKEMVELQKKNLANDAPPSAPESPPWKAHPHPNSPRAEYASQ